MMGIAVIFLWVPAHIGIKGNKMADKYIDVAVSKTEIKSVIKQREGKGGKSYGRKRGKGRWFYKNQKRVGEKRCAGTGEKRQFYQDTGLNSTLFTVGKQVIKNSLHYTQGVPQ